jgi:hypothetical protein
MGKARTCVCVPFSSPSASITAAAVSVLTPILLAGNKNKISVADCKILPQPSVNVVRAEFLQFIFDPPRHNVLVARQQVHAPHGIVGEVLRGFRSEIWGTLRISSPTKRPVTSDR